jgi:hypothetical protein
MCLGVSDHTPSFLTVGYSPSCRLIVIRQPAVVGDIIRVELSVEAAVSPVAVGSATAGWRWRCSQAATGSWPHR